MAKKYIAVRIPKDAWKGFKIKQQKMENMYFKITGKRKGIPLTKVVMLVSKDPVYINDKELVKMFGKRVRKI